MEENPNKRAGIPGWLKLLLKIAVTIACVWYVSGKIDFKKAGLVFSNVNWLYLFFALIAFAGSKLLSAVRLNIYFRNIGIHLSAWQNIKLYWLGMFYNLFLPGSITGDAYKVILLTKKYTIPYKKTTAAVLLDRFSGLLGLGLLLAGYSVIALHNPLSVALIAAGSFAAVFLLFIIIKKGFPDFAGSFFSTLLLGLLVQCCQVVCAYLIIAALEIPFHTNEYIFIFLVSSVVSILPLTIGGLGIREVVFLEGSKFFELMQETSVVISLLFYLITLLVSAVGLINVFNDPLKEKIKDPLLSP